jgi:hypothetical protein
MPTLALDAAADSLPATVPASQPTPAARPAVPRSLREMDFRNAAVPLAVGGQPVQLKDGRARWEGGELLLLDVAFGDVTGDRRTDAVLSFASGAAAPPFTLRVVVLEGSPQSLRVHLVHDFFAGDLDLAERALVDGRELVVQGKTLLPGQGCLARKEPYASRYLIKRGQLVRVSRKGPSMPPQTRMEKRKATPAAPRPAIRLDWPQDPLDRRE